MRWTPTRTHRSTAGALLWLSMGCSALGEGPERTTIYPAAHPEFDRHDHQHLIPNTTVSMYFEHAESGHLSASVHIPEMEYPAVNLLHSAYVEKVYCDDSSAQIHFSDPAAHATALAHWQDMAPFVLIHYHSECGDVYSGRHHGYLLVDSLTSLTPRDYSRSVHARVSHVGFEQAVGGNNKIKTNIGMSPTLASAKQEGAQRASHLTFDERLDVRYGRRLSVQVPEDRKQLVGVPQAISRRGLFHKVGVPGMCACMPLKFA